jgi:regulator of cell morphogenesis and NO signaling
MHIHMEAQSETADGRPRTVGQWVARFPQSAKVFEARGIDYCCGGKLSLKDVCVQSGLDPAVLNSDLEDALKNPGPARTTDWKNAALKDLADHIEKSHHAFIRSERPRLTVLAQKVAQVHGLRHPELAELAVTVDQVFRELEPHLEKEEKDIFPACRNGSDREGQDGPDSAFVSAVNDLEVEHIEVGRLLAGIRKLTAGYRPPQDACNSYLALFHGLERFEADLHEHIHLENNILLPRMASSPSRAKEGDAKAGYVNEVHAEEPHAKEAHAKEAHAKEAHGSPDTCCGICSVS